ncbi:ankyrin repeat domain-containing protein [Wolbachia endosymbiont of Nasonia giraulti]|uniref:ankyrin repeat domain-containing protein n=1 Tax=Wolbachia endosymbiont of Nasonia giraulti TaxID=180838 RepID=UPI003A8887AA
MPYKSLKKVLRTINDKKDLDKDNIIEKIKTELKEQDQGLYQKWESNGSDVNYVFNSSLSSMKFTLLTIAAEYGYANIVKILLEKEADVHKKGHFDMTPLHFAARNGYANMVKILLKKGANVNEKGYFDTTPLHFAACNGHEKTVEVLLEKGANVNEKGYLDMTPLHFAACNGHEKTIEVLIQAGANVNAVDEYGKTTLGRAKEYIKKCAEGYAKGKNAIKALLEAGRGPFVKACNKSMIAGGVTGLLGTAIAVALFTTGTIAVQLIPIVIAVVAVTAAALVVGCATYELLKPSTKVDGAEKSSAVLTTNEQREAAL